MSTPHEKALRQLRNRVEQLRERADALEALTARVEQNPNMTENEFRAATIETHAADWEDYNERYRPMRYVDDWLQENTYPA